MSVPGPRLVTRLVGEDGLGGSIHDPVRRRRARLRRAGDGLVDDRFDAHHPRAPPLANVTPRCLEVFRGCAALDRRPLGTVTVRPGSGRQAQTPPRPARGLRWPRTPTAPNEAATGARPRAATTPYSRGVPGPRRSPSL